MKNGMFKELVFSTYQKLPMFFKSIITRIVYKPKIGKNVGFFGNILFEENVYIGDYSAINQDCFLSNINIGKYCSIAKNFAVVGANHNYKFFSTYTFFQQTNSPLRLMEKIDNDSDITGGGTSFVGNDVWIGESVTIMRGVKVGDGAVIGARSLVTKDIPPYAIAVGIPCKVIGYRFEQNIIDKLLNSAWWDYEPEKLYKEYKNLSKLVK